MSERVINLQQRSAARRHSELDVCRRVEPVRKVLRQVEHFRRGSDFDLDCLRVFKMSGAIDLLQSVLVFYRGQILVVR